MAGDLIVDKVAASSVATKVSLVRGLTKSWANLNGTGTIALRNSLNIASIVDSGTGRYDFNFTSVFSGVDFAVSSSCDAIDTATANPFQTSASSIQIRTYNTSFTPTDALYARQDCRGDLA